jgi:hypothetical protein
MQKRHRREQWLSLLDRRLRISKDDFILAALGKRESQFYHE